MIQTFTHPRGCDFSRDFKLSVDGVPVEVLSTEAADFANFIFDPSNGPVEVIVTRMSDTINGFQIRPLKCGIEGGAILRTRIVTSNAEHVNIRGHGIFDGSYFRREWGDRVPSIVLDHCRHVTVRDITMIRPSGWMLLLGACEDVEVVNFKQVGEVVNSDGIDIVGSKRVHVHDCFLRITTRYADDIVSVHQNP